MATKQAIDEFLSLDTIALVGASQNEKRYGCIVYKTLKQKGLRVIPVNKKYSTVDNDTCYPDLKSLPKKADGVIVLTARKNSEEVVRDAIAAGAKHIWIQNGSETQEAISAGENSNASVISKKCILMYADPVAGMHKFHRGLVKLFGRLYN